MLVALLSLVSAQNTTNSTSPPPPPPVTPSPSTAPFTNISTASVSWCLASCNSTTLTAATTAVCAAAGCTGCTNSGCGTSCSSRRALKQSGGSTVTVNLPSTATTLQAQALQNAIIAGNLVYLGIPTTATVVVNSPAGFTASPSPVPFAPSAPGSPNGVTACACTTTGTSGGTTCTVMPCVGLSTCILQLNALYAQLGSSNVIAACCSTNCNYRQQRRSLSATGGVQLKVSGTNKATVCAALIAAGVNSASCGKTSKKALLGLLGLLGLIPLFLVLLLCCLCLLRRKRRGQAMLFSVTNAPAAPPAPLPHMHAPIIGGPASFHP